MSDNLLATKLHVPQPRAAVVARLRLTELIGRSQVTLVSAPAGSGKTTALAEWAAQQRTAVCWLSLEPAESDPARFWRYLVASMRTVNPQLGEALLTLLRTPLPPTTESLLAGLINDLAALSAGFSFVLEDYHEIDSPAVHDGLLFLIDHLPPAVRLVVTSRVDPPLPLTRLRASGLLTEVRAADLRFTQEEASAFLNDAMGLDLPSDLVAALEARTEGWVVGLQLAAISLQGRPDPAKFVDDFSGSNRYILDYLVQEVLERQPPDIQSFLLKTSVLDRLCGPLGDAVTGCSGGQATLERLDRENLFTMPLDEERRWYRYHYLFAESLRRILRQRHAAEVAELRRRAAAWFRQNGLLAEALEQALAAADFDAAADLIQQAADTTLWRDSQRVTVLNWLDALPTELVRSRPRLCLLHAWARFTTGDWEGVDPLLRDAEEAMRHGVESIAAGAVLGEVAAIRSGIAYEAGDMQLSASLARRSLDLVPETNPTVRAVAAFQLGLSSFWTEDFDSARASYDAAMVMAREADNASIALLALGGHAQLSVRQGHLRRAAGFYHQARRFRPAHADTPLAPAGLAYVQMGEVLRELNELDQAEHALREGVALCEQQGGMPEFVLEGVITLARVCHAKSDDDGVLAAIRRADELHAELRLRSGNVRPIISQALAYRARLSLARGDIAGVAQWAEDARLDTAGPIGVVNRGDFAVVARLLWAHDRRASALVLLDRLLETAPDEVAAIEPLTVKALVLSADGDAEQGACVLARALPAAEREGYVRLFLDEGEPMRVLLARVPKGAAAASYAEDLLEMSRDGAPAPETIPLVEPLNERELAILRCMAAGRSNQEIANELYLSVNTVKWHARNLYGKLGVTSRAKAGARARELRLL